MRLFRPSAAVLLLLTMLQPLPGAEAASVPLIFDTDMSGDCDDAGALALLHALADQGECEILATVVNRKDFTAASAAATDAINTFYGRPDLPIGTDKQGPTALQRTSAFARALRDEFPNDIGSDDRAPDALDVYRRVLAAQPDGRVVICSVGALSNLAELWRRAPELVRQKVRRLVVMGGQFPQSEQPETNIATHREAAQLVAAEWPGDIVWHGWEVGQALITGAALQAVPAKNPVRRAYELKPFGKRPAIDGGQASWDQGAALFAVRGAQPKWWEVVRGGRVRVDARGNTTWVADANARHSYVKIKGEPKLLAAEMERLMIQPPKASQSMRPAASPSFQTDPDTRISAPPVRIFFDTDMHTDCDDAGALAVLHALADRGECEILATVVSVKDHASAATVDAINIFYGRTNLPLGMVKGPGVRRKSNFTARIAADFPQRIKSAEDVPDATAVYRDVLERQPDSTVVVVTVGYLTNLRNLLQLPATPGRLSGRALIQRKVVQWVCMGGNFVGSPPKDDLKLGNVNFQQDAAATLETIRHWPGSVVFVGREIGSVPSGLQVGANLVRTPATNPVRLAYFHYFGGQQRSRHVADLTTVLYAVRGLRDYWDISAPGRMNLQSDASFAWQFSAAGNQRFLLKRLQDGKPNDRYLESVLDELLLKPPAAAASSASGGSARQER